MYFENIKAWLNEIVDTIEHLNDIRNLNTSVLGCGNEDSYLIHKGIDIVADAMRIPIKEKKYENPYYFSTVYYFYYRGIKFYDCTGEIPDGPDGED